MNRLSIFIGILFICNRLFAQFPSAAYEISKYSIVDTTKCVLTYTMKFKKHPQDKEYLSDVRKVEVGKNIVKDYSYIQFYYDSLTTSNNKKGVDSPTPQKEFFPYEVLNYYKENKAMVSFRMFLSAGILQWFDHDDGEQHWNLETGDSTTIHGYLCSKASTEFLGRQYSAWYTTDIPLNAGPYRFCGLPGLIMKIEESSKMYSWELDGMEFCLRPIYLYKYDLINKCTREEGLKAIRQMYSTPFTFLSVSNVRVSIKNSTGDFSAPRKEIQIPYEDIDNR